MRLKNCKYCNSLHKAIENQNYCSNTGDDKADVSSNAYYFKLNKMQSGKHVSRLSIRTISHGYQSHQVDNQNFLLDKYNYLLVEEGATFESNFDTNNPSEGLLVAFNLNDVYSYSNFLNKSDRQLLDNPFSITDFTTDIRSQLIEKRPAINYVFDTIKNGFVHDIHDKIYYEELFQLLIQEMHGDYTQAKRREFNIKTAKRSTKEELIRRIKLAKTYIDLNLHEQITIEELAKIALMSPFHFSRVFKLYFGYTPHKYLTKKRIQKASFLLEDSEQGIAHIAQQVGFQNHSAFGRRFKSSTGLLPKEYRLRSKASPNEIRKIM